jgi:DNA-binding NarL/FixJ family response regulator
VLTAMIAEKPEKIRLVLVDDHDLVREGLKRILESTGEFEVVGEAARGDEATGLYRDVNPDVIVTDLSWPGADGIDATLALRKVAPDARIIMLTMYSDEHHAVRALRAGAAGFVSKDSPSDVLIDAIRRVAHGERYIPPEIVEAVTKLLESDEVAEPQPLAARLSKRELEVLRYLSAGKTNREIAKHLEISSKTIDTHRNHLLKKLNLRNNADLTRFAIRHGLIAP